MSHRIRDFLLAGEVVLWVLVGAAPASPVRAHAGAVRLGLMLAMGFGSGLMILSPNEAAYAV